MVPAEAGGIARLEIDVTSASNVADAMTTSTHAAGLASLRTRAVYHAPIRSIFINEMMFAPFAV